MGIAAQPTRENRTITVDFRSEATYFQLLGDGKAFLECVLAFVMSLGFQLKHKATCRGGGYLTRHSHEARANLANISWLFVTFGDSGSRKQHCHEQGASGELENPCESMEK